MDLEDKEEQSAPKAESEEPAKVTVNLLPTLLPPLLSLIRPVSQSFPPLLGSVSAVPLEEQPKSHPPTSSALSAIHTGALECLNNIFLALALGGSESTTAKTASTQISGDVSAGKGVWDGVWAALAIVGVEGLDVPGQEKRMEMWDVAVGVLWGVGGIWKGSIVSHDGRHTLNI